LLGQELVEAHPIQDESDRFFSSNLERFTVGGVDSCAMDESLGETVVGFEAEEPQPIQAYYSRTVRWDSNLWMLFQDQNIGAGTGCL